MKNLNGLKKYKLLIVLISVLVFSVLTFVILFFYFEDPKKVISRKTGITLSENDVIINYDRIYFDYGISDSVYAKLRINESEKDNVINQLEHEKILPSFNGKSDDYLYIHNLYDWFSIDEGNIVYLLQSYRMDRKFRDKGFHKIWIIITCEYDLYYLYIAVS